MKQVVVGSKTIPLPIKLEQVKQLFRGYKQYEDSLEDGKITMLMVGIEQGTLFFSFDNYMENGDVYRISLKSNSGITKLCQKGFWGYR